MSKKKFWTYNLSKAKKSGSKLLNNDYEAFLAYANSYNTWKVKKWNKSSYVASIKGFKKYGTILFNNKGKNLKSGIKKAKFTNMIFGNKKTGTIKISNIKSSIGFYEEVFVTTSAKIKKKLIGSKFNDDFTFGGGNDIMLGNGGNDKLNGADGNDLLNGGSGNDVLNGGNGKNTLIGGKGKDIFELSKGKGFDMIKDFKDKEDKITFGAFPTKNLKLKNKGKDAYIYYVGEGNDLLAKVKGAAGKLSSSGTYLI